MNTDKGGCSVAVPREGPHTRPPTRSSSLICVHPFYLCSKTSLVPRDRSFAIRIIEFASRLVRSVRDCLRRIRGSPRQFRYITSTYEQRSSQGQEAQHSGQGENTLVQPNTRRPAFQVPSTTPSSARPS